MIHKTQDPKYVIIENKLCNSSTHKPIPEDEPIFIFRAQDNRAGKYIHEYAQDCENDHHTHVVEKRAFEFQRFKHNHPERIKEPDTG